MTETDDLISEIIEELHRKVPFDQEKGNVVAHIIRETPDEISRIVSVFKTNETDKVVTNENDFLLGNVISFIYYRFLHTSVLEGNPIRPEEISVFRSWLFSIGPKLMGVIVRVKGK